MSAEAWTILGTGGALFIGLAGLAVAIWRSLSSRLELLAQQQAEALRDLRAEQAMALRDLRAEQAVALRDLRAEQNARFDSVDTRFDSVDARLDRLEDRQYEMAQALARLDGPVREPVAREPAP